MRGWALLAVVACTGDAGTDSPLDTDTADADSDSDSDSAANAAPVVADVESAAQTWTLGAGAVHVSDAVTVSDADDATLVGATVTVTSGYQEGFDGLAISNRPVGISASFDAPTGTLTITGDVAVQVYENTLRGVTYDNAGGVGLNGSAREVTFVADDGEDTSAPVSRTVQLEAR